MTYDEARVRWIRQVEGRVVPNADEIACYWPDIDCTDMLSRADIQALPQPVYAKLFGPYRTLCGDEYDPEVISPKETLLFPPQTFPGVPHPTCEHGRRWQDTCEQCADNALVG